MEEDLFEDEKEPEASEKRKGSGVIEDESPDVFTEDGTTEVLSDLEEEKNLEALQINEAIEEVFQDHDETEGVADEDDENWIPLDEEEDLDILEEDDATDDHEEIEAIDLEEALIEDDEEADMTIREAGGETASGDDDKVYASDNADIDEVLEDFEVYDETETSDLGDGEDWMALDEGDDSRAEVEDDPMGIERGLEDDLEAEDEQTDDSPEAIDLEKIIEEESLDIDDSLEIDGKNAEAPPWDEEVEIPLHGTAETTRKKRTILVAFILFLVALTGVTLYGFYKFKLFSEKQNPLMKGEEQTSPVVSSKVPNKAEEITAPRKTPDQKALLEGQPLSDNVIPTISGEPLLEARPGVLYRFSPQANDENPSDKLTFFIANQPVWTTFDITTGALTGTPSGDDAGVYKNIAILVTDGRATASLPVFDIMVTGDRAEVVRKEDKQAAQEAPAPDRITDIKSGAKSGPVEEKSPVLEAGPHLLPDLSDLIKQMEFRDAAIEYHKNVREVPQAYSYKLEVDCAEKSVQVAFQACNLDPRMFILPRQINGRGCFVVLWGLYPTKNKALKALSSIPAFFKTQETKPKLIILKQYL